MMNKIIEHLYYYLKLLRPRQWIKNLALFAAITFGGQLPLTDLIAPFVPQFKGVADYEPLFKVMIGFVAFSLLSSATYILNDILDVKKDRLHPFKKHRPLASGKVKLWEAIILFIICVTVSFYLAATLRRLFVTIEFVYIILQVLYSFVFKSVVIFDILFIATGYILRVLAGEILSDYHISVWLLLTTVSLSLFLAVGKRRSELTLLKKVHDMARIDEVRKSLSHYSENLLDVFSTMFATSTFMFYAMFTFLENPSGIKLQVNLLLPDFLPYYLQRKWLMVTIIPVVYGLMRYLQDIYEKNEGESPERVLLSDKSLLASLILWVLLVIFIIYFVS